MEDYKEKLRLAKEALDSSSYDKETNEEEKPNGGIVLEDFNEGEGFYKVNLAYLNKEQVIEIEELIKKWNPEIKESEDERIRKNLREFLLDVPSQDIVSHHIDLEETLNWLEKQGELVKESEGERIRSILVDFFKDYYKNTSMYFEDVDVRTIIAWLEKQGEQKEINLVEILKHYPKETKLYSPIYGKLWLAEVDEEHEIITCYKYPLGKYCKRAILEQEDTVSFYSNGTTVLPDLSINEKQGEQTPTWSEEDEKMFKLCTSSVQTRYDDSLITYNEYEQASLWLIELKERIKGEI